MTDLRYPIGDFQVPSQVGDNDRRRFIEIIEITPTKMRSATMGLDDGQFDTPYRPGGWTLRQLVHHVPDSHLNAYIRFKLAVTEDVPTIKPYDEQQWAKLED